MKMDDKGMASVPGVFGIPAIFLIIVVVVVLFLLLGGWILIAFTTKTLIVVVLLGLGVFLLVKKGALAGLGEYGIWIALSLILLAVLFYAGIFNGLFGG